MSAVRYHTDPNAVYTDSDEIACDDEDCLLFHHVDVDADEWEAIELVLDSALKVIAWWDPIRNDPNLSRSSLTAMPDVMNGLWASYATLLYARQHPEEDS